MALSTSITVVTRSGLSTHDHYDVRNLFSVGVATFSNFKTGTTNVHNVGVEAAGINVLGADTPIGTGSTIYDDGGARFSGIVTASGFSGDGSALIGVASTDNIKTSTTANFSDGIQVGGSTTLTGALSATTATANVIVVGSAVTSNSQGIDVTGVITATSFSGTLAASNLTGALPAISGANLTGIDTSFGSGTSINTTGIITAAQVKTLNGTASLNKHSVGIGTTTTTGRNAGVGTAGGTIVYNTSSGQLEIYTSNKWVAVYEPPFEATGGTKNTSSRSGYAVHTFTGPGTFEVSGSPKAGGEYLIVGGGGGGGKGGLGGTGFEVGGGGAGGHRSFSGQTLTPGSYAVVVGSGGPGGGTGDGGNSSVFGETAAGGGGGAGHTYGGSAGRPGGSGGGGAHHNTSGGSGNSPPVSPPQGNSGGPGGTSTGGGGGGANGGGGGGSGSGGHGGSAGSGTSNSITGSGVTRAGGGGGGGYGNRAPGGSGGGGPGGVTNASPPQGGAQSSGDPATANTGSGGGGSGFNLVPGGNGGSGVVIIAYPTS